MNFDLPSRTSKYIRFAGGLDEVTPPIETAPGTLRDCQNYEIDVNGGYKTAVGYERFDGQPSPSSAQYAILPETTTGTFAASDLVTGGPWDSLIGEIWTQRNSLHPSTPDSAAASIVSSLCLIAYATATDWTPVASKTVLGKWDATNNKRSYLLSLVAGGALNLKISSDGIAEVSADSTVATGITDGAGKWVGVVWNDATNTATFYTSTSDNDAAISALSWVALGAPVALASAGVNDNNQIVEVGSFEAGTAWAGSIYRAAIISGTTITGAAAVEYYPYRDAPQATVVSVETGYLVVTKLNGVSFAAGDTLQVSLVTQGSATDAETIDGASTTKLHAQYKNAAADVYRADIAAIPGVGNVLGIWRFSGTTYGFRNIDVTNAAMYKSSATGWTLVALGRELAFTSGGTYQILDGDTITGAISAATAVVTRVMLESGTWAAGTAAGKLIFASQTGTFQAENLDVGANLNVATIAGNSSAITLLKDGRYEFVTANFGSGSRIYGCDRVNRGFEFDGTVFCPIKTGMATDTPNHVYVHKNHLFFAFANNAQASGIGTPYAWTPLTGASTLNVLDTITGFKGQPGIDGSSALAIFSRNKIHVLYGSSSSDWNLVPYRDEIGAYAHTIQDVGVTVMVDDKGISDLRTSQEFGNFANSQIGRLVQDFMNEHKTTATASCVVREKSQYRVFFSDGSAMFLTFGPKKLLGCMPQLWADAVTCACSIEDSGGSEVILFGSDNGMVYQMEKGTSHDGVAIECLLSTHYLHLGSPGWNKSFKDLMLEISGDGYAEFNFSYEIGYASSLIPQSAAESVVAVLSSAQWDVFTWDSFFWDGVTLSPVRLKLDGTAENIALQFYSNSDYFSPIRFSGGFLNHIKRRQVRG